MKVSEVMSRNVRTCCATDTLNDAAQAMWENDCGAVPIVDSNGKLIAMLTDRDICMAAYTQGRPLHAIPVPTASSRTLATVRDTDSIQAAQAVMIANHVRRLPVVDAAGNAIGILSMNDLAKVASECGTRRDAVTPEQIVQTLTAVCRRTPAQNAAQALSTAS
jgi:CBS domain-containing protein